MRPLILVTALVLGPGCKSGLFAADDPYEFTGNTLVFNLDSDQVDAGGSVTYTAWLIDEHDLPIEGVTWTITSDREAGLEYSSAAVMPRVSGPHAVTATVVHDGVTYSETESLSVVAGPPFDLDLKLSDLQMAAGDSITWEADVVDAWGNGLGTEGILVEVEDTETVTLDGDHLTSTVPGTWLVTATYEDLDDAETFVVVPGPPVGVSLDLSSTDLELLQTTSAVVSVWDEFGNESDAPWTVWTDRPTAAAVSHRNVTFLAEGWHTVHVTVDGTSLTDAVGPFLIDSTAPWLEITSPPRGSWRTTTTQTVTGTVHDDWSSVSSVTVNGYPVTPGTGGAFSRDLSLYFGTNLIESVAIDADGNASSDTRALLQGAFRAYNTSSPTGVQVRLQEGAGGLGTLAAIGEGLVTSTDLGALIPDPVFYDYEEDCFIICVMWYRIRLRVTNPSISGVDLYIDPRNGYMFIDFYAWDPRLTWRATDLYLVFDSLPSQSGTITASYIRVWGNATPSVSNGTLGVGLSGVGVNVQSLNFNWNSWVWDVLEFFGVGSWIEGLIEGAVEGAIRDAVVAEVPAALRSALQDLELVYPIPLGGRTFTLTAKPDAVSVNDTGLSLSMGTKVTTNAWTHPGYSGLGSLNRNYTPSTSFTKPMTVSFSGDFVNQLLYAVWGGGLLDISQSSDSLGLPAEDLGILLPGVTSVTVKATPLLPPVVVPGYSGWEYELQVGDLEVTLYDGPAANNDVLIKAYVTAYVPLNLTNVGDTRLSASLGTPEIYFDVIVPEANTLAAADTEALFEALVPLLLPRLTQAISEIDIPSIAGFGISGITVSTGGSYNGYLRLGGSLYEE